MSSTFKIHQENCTGCAACVELAPNQIVLNDEGIACFSSTGTDTANFGTEDVSLVIVASEYCPNKCIEEIG